MQLVFVCLSGVDMQCIELLLRCQIIDGVCDGLLTTPILKGLCVTSVKGSCLTPLHACNPLVVLYTISLNIHYKLILTVLPSTVNLTLLPDVLYDTSSSKRQRPNSPLPSALCAAQTIFPSSILQAYEKYLLSDFLL